MELSVAAKMKQKRDIPLQCCSDSTRSPSRPIGLNSNWIGLVSHHCSMHMQRQLAEPACVVMIPFLHMKGTCLKFWRSRLREQVHEHGLPCAHSPIHVQPSWNFGPLRFGAPQKTLPPVQRSHLPGW